MYMCVYTYIILKTYTSSRCTHPTLFVVLAPHSLAGAVFMCVYMYVVCIHVSTHLTHAHSLFVVGFAFSDGR